MFAPSVILPRPLALAARLATLDLKIMRGRVSRPGAHASTHMGMQARGRLQNHVHF